VKRGILVGLGCLAAFALWSATRSGPASSLAQGAPEEELSRSSRSPSRSGAEPLDERASPDDPAAMLEKMLRARSAPKKAEAESASLHDSNDEEAQRKREALAQLPVAEREVLEMYGKMTASLRHTDDCDTLANEIDQLATSHRDALSALVVSQGSAQLREDSSRRVEAAAPDQLADVRVAMRSALVRCAESEKFHGALAHLASAR
jgi:hypothetical protein